MGLHPIWIPDSAPARAFPDVEFALIEPNGLLALGADLSVERLLYAYRHGIFPWYSEDQPILWWSPDPRMVLEPQQFHISRSLHKRLRNKQYRITRDQDFAAVVRACAQPRTPEGGTWILPEMFDAYVELHALGHAHSVEIWLEDELVGGIYGVSIGQVFFGESMFSRRSDTSKMALAHLCTLGYQLIDCQVPSEHLISLGAVLISRSVFCARLTELCALQSPQKMQPGAHDS
jgi:leucyl/phenylalanyl-tRNA--protein transferase